MSGNRQQWAALDSQHERLVDVSSPLPGTELPAGRSRSRHRRMAVAATGPGGLALWPRPARRRLPHSDT
jgi:hypothetical protein